jgi:hypothetical protein
MSAALMVLSSCSDCAQRLEADYKAVTDKEKAEVVQLGGLHVVGTERHVSLKTPLFRIHPTLLHTANAEFLHGITNLEACCMLYLVFYGLSVHILLYSNAD